MGSNAFLPTTGREGHIFPLDVVGSCTINCTLCVCVYYHSCHGNSHKK